MKEGFLSVFEQVLGRFPQRLEALEAHEHRLAEELIQQDNRGVLEEANGGRCAGQCPGS